MNLKFLLIPLSSALLIHCFTVTAGWYFEKQITTCDVFGTCSQVCADNTGEAHCSCIDGFKLAQNGWGCDPVDGNLNLIYATPGSIGFIPRINREGKLAAQSLQLNPGAEGLTYDARNKIIYFTNNTGNRHGIYRTGLHENATVEVVADTGISLIRGIAFDWIAGNIYFVDYDNNRIGLCKNDSTACAVVVLNSCYTDNIALHPNLGYIFWTCPGWRTTAAIFRASMDGSSQTSIITTDLGTPGGITVDAGGSRIYWLDNDIGRIESSYFDGTGRITAISDASILYSPGLDLFGDRLYWYNKNGEIQSAEKFGGVNTTISYHLNIKSIYAMSIFQLAKQQITRKNPCKKANCSHICVLSSARGYECFCPVGMRKYNNRTCREWRDAPKLIFAFGDTIKSMLVGTFGKEENVWTTYSLKGRVTAISAIVYNSVNRTLILSDEGSKRIYEYDLYYNQLSVLVNEDIDTVTCLDIDVVGQMLYWADRGRRTIEALSLRTGARILVRSGLWDVTDIVVLPEKTLMFIATFHKGTGTIYKMSLSGSHFSVFRNLERKEPAALAYSQYGNNVFWMDKSGAMLMSAPLFGNMTTLEMERMADSPSDLIIFGNSVYSSSTGAPHVYVAKVYGAQAVNWVPLTKKNCSAPNNKIPLEGKLAVTVSRMTGLQDLLKNHDCAEKSVHRKNCSHACLLTAHNYVGECRCPVGWTLGEDALTCIPRSTCPLNQFSCNNGHCIPVDDVCNGYDDCGDNEDESNCPVNVYTPEKFQCGDTATFIPTKWVCDQKVDCVGGEDENYCTALPRKSKLPTPDTIEFPRSFEPKEEHEGGRNSGVLIWVTSVSLLLAVCLPVGLYLLYRSRSHVLSAREGSVRYNATTSVIFISEAVNDAAEEDEHSRKQKLTDVDIRQFKEGVSDKFVTRSSCDNNYTSAYKLPYDVSFEMRKDKLNIAYNQILGSGQFGCVFKATIEALPHLYKRVAVKIAKDCCPSYTLKGMLSEIKIMIYIGKHPNIVALEGAYTAEIQRGVVYIATELCELGSLQGYLRKQEKISRLSFASRTKIHLGQDRGLLEPISYQQMLQWSKEIALGMEYLGARNVVHADLASRNILLTSEKVAKISDFGLSRRMYDYTNYIKSSQEPLPWRWMAKEALKKCEFSIKSDVWSYAVTLWEIFSLGDVPYPGLAWTVDFVGMLENGLRLGLPTFATPELYNMMVQCWCPDPAGRPSFSTILQVISVNERNTGGYHIYCNTNVEDNVECM